MAASNSEISTFQTHYLYIFISSSGATIKCDTFSPSKAKIISQSSDSLKYNAWIKKRINWFSRSEVVRNDSNRKWIVNGATGRDIDCPAMHLAHIRSIFDQWVFGHRRVLAPAIWCQLCQPQRPMWKSIKTDDPIPLQRISSPLSPAI